MSNSKFNVRLLTEIAFMAALAFIISLIPNTVYGWIIVEILYPYPSSQLTTRFNRWSRWRINLGNSFNDYWTCLYLKPIPSFH